MRDSEKRKDRAGRGVWSLGLGRLGVRAGWGSRGHVNRDSDGGWELSVVAQAEGAVRSSGLARREVVEGEDSAASSRTHPPPLKCTVPWLLVCSQSHATMTTNPRIFPTPERKPAPLSSQPHALPGNTQLLSPRRASPFWASHRQASSSLHPLCLAPPTELEALGVRPHCHTCHAPSIVAESS